jgi:CheY-like chemotaxis protein
MNENHTRTLVLVVDDDSDVRDSTSGLLESLGYAVATASSSKEAMSEIWSRQPDIVLTDIYMPEGDGYELINAIRSFGEDVPVIVMTGGDYHPFSDQVGLALAEGLGAAATITKPFLALELLETIERVMDTRIEEKVSAGRSAQASGLAAADRSLRVPLKWYRQPTDTPTL